MTAVTILELPVGRGTYGGPADVAFAESLTCNGRLRKMTTGTLVRRVLRADHVSRDACERLLRLAIPDSNVLSLCIIAIERCNPRSTSRAWSPWSVGVVAKIASDDDARAYFDLALGRRRTTSEMSLSYATTASEASLRVLGQSRDAHCVFRVLVADADPDQGGFADGSGIVAFRRLAQMAVASTTTVR